MMVRCNDKKPNLKKWFIIQISKHDRTNHFANNKTTVTLTILLVKGFWLQLLHFSTLNTIGIKTRYESGKCLQGIDLILKQIKNIWFESDKFS